MSDENNNGTEQHFELPQQIVTPTLGARLVIPGMCLFAIILVLITQWKPGSGSFRLSLSSDGIKVRYVDREIVASGETDLVWLSEDELLTQDTAVIRCVIFSVNNVEIDFGGGEKEFRTILGAEVTETIRGELGVGDTISVLVPSQERSADDEVVPRLTEGAVAILMPKRLDETRTVSRGGKTLYLMELSGFELPDAERFAFVGADGGVVFAGWAYPSLEGAESLDAVSEFIRQKLS